MERRVAMNQENNRSSNWGGARENAGRKSTWNHKKLVQLGFQKYLLQNYMKMHKNGIKIP